MDSVESEEVAKKPYQVKLGACFLKLRYSFYLINICLLITGLIGFIYGHIRFTYYDSTTKQNLIEIALSGSFVGGILPIISIAIVFLTITGLFGAWRCNRSFLTTYGTIVATSLLLRLGTWISYWLHGYTPFSKDRWYYMMYFVLEILLSLNAFSLSISIKHSQSVNNIP